MALVEQDQIYRPSQGEILSFIVEDGENLPAGINIESELEKAMEGHGGSLQYWAPNAEVGTTQGFDKSYFQRKFDATHGILRAKGIEVNEADVEKTQAFIDEIFGIYNGEQEPYRHGGSFAFVAASRTKRRDTNEFTALDYRRETVGCLPILKYVDESTAQRILVGMPPFILDYYGDDDQGGGGVMIFAPLSLDMVGDLVEQQGGDAMAAIGVAEKIAKETSWFAKERVGVKLMSLAALLPKSTNYGQLFEYPGIETTTGHGGTTWLIGETAEEAVRQGRVDPRLEARRSVLGVGDIGFAVADLMLGSNPDIQVAINDHNPERLGHVAQQLGDRYGEKRVIVEPSVAQLLRFGGVTVSAITKGVDLEAIGLKPGDLDGRVYADDSQPAAIAAEQVIEFGGTHLGVIAEDGTPFGAVSPMRFNYGGMGPLEGNAYGCCVEGASLYYGGGMEEALTSPVDGDRTRAIGEYCKQLGFSVATLQTILHGKSQFV